MKEIISVRIDKNIKEISRIIPLVTDGTGKFFEKAFWRELQIVVNENPKIIELLSTYLDEEAWKELKSKIDF